MVDQRQVPELWSVGNGWKEHQGGFMDNGGQGPWIGNGPEVVSGRKRPRLFKRRKVVHVTGRTPNPRAPQISALRIGTEGFHLISQSP